MPVSPRDLADELVIALQEAAEAEAAAWTNTKRPVVGTWGGRILSALARHGLAVVRVEQLPSAVPSGAETDS